MSDELLAALLAMARRVLERRAARQAVEQAERRRTLRVVRRDDAA